MVTAVSIPVRRYAADQQEEALSFAEEGGIAVIPVAVGYMVLGRRRQLETYAQERRWYIGASLVSQVPTSTGVNHLVATGQRSRELERELGIGLLEELG